MTMCVMALLVGKGVELGKEERSALPPPPCTPKDSTSTSCELLPAHPRTPHPRPVNSLPLDLQELSQSLSPSENLRFSRSPSFFPRNSPSPRPPGTSTSLTRTYGSSRIRESAWPRRILPACGVGGPRELQGDLEPISRRVILPYLGKKMGQYHYMGLSWIILLLILPCQVSVRGRAVLTILSFSASTYMQLHA